MKNDERKMIYASFLPRQVTPVQVSDTTMLKEAAFAGAHSFLTNSTHLLLQQSFLYWQIQLFFLKTLSLLYNLRRRENGGS
jgi:hypothetical protein